MKKTVKLISLVLVLISLMLFSITGCEVSDNSTESNSSTSQSNSSSEGGNKQTEVNVSEKSVQKLANINTTISNDVAKLEHTFKDKNGCWNYVFYSGSIHNVPLQNFAGLERYYSNSLENRTLEVETTVTKAEEIKNIVNRVSTFSIEENIEHEWAAKAGLQYKKNFFTDKIASSQLTANLELSYKGARSKNEINSSTYSSSYEQTAQTIVTESKKETIIFNKDTESGFYGNTRLGSIKVYTYVCYDPQTTEFYVEYFGDIVTDYWAFVYLTEEEYNLSMVENRYSAKISFDLPELKEPGTYDVDKNSFYVISYNANGGEVVADDGTPISSNSYQVGELTKAPKINEKPGYDLAGWTYDYPYFEFGQNMPAAYVCATANWKPKSVYYDSGEAYNRIDASHEYTLDTIDLSSLSPFMKTNSTFTFTISIYIIEVNEGYQEFYLSTSSEAGAPSLAGKGEREFAHGGSGVDKNGGWDTFTYTIEASKCSNVMYIRYGASGSSVDDWIRARTTVSVTVNVQN